MAVIAPQTDVFLLKVPLEINDLNQLTFANATAQYNYFISLPKLEVTNFTYQRKDGTIRYGANFDDLLSYNYVMYRNDAYSNKWFFAFITGMEYLNDNVTAISIKTDVWQTWQFDLTFKPCLIDREHTNDDTVGKNTLPEGLELGEMVANGRTVNFGLPTSNDQLMLIADVSMIENWGTNSTLTYSWDSGSTPISTINGIPSGSYHIVIDSGTLYLGNLGHFISVYEKAGLSDAIQDIYVLPKNIVGSNDIKTGLTISTTGAAPSDSISGLGMISSTFRGVTSMGNGYLTIPTTINGYTPKNNKLLCYPYNYFNVSNNGGTTLPYHYEDFVPTSNRISFEVEGVFCISGSIKATPVDYKNLSYQQSDNRYDYSINAVKYPVCSWKSDSYTNWLTQNAVNMKTQWKTELISSGAEILGGAAFGGVVGLGAGVLAAGKNLIGLAREQMLAKTSANMVPDQVQGNGNAGDIVYSKLGSQFTFMPMSIKAEYARCIDEYFSQFGYKCNRVKVPNITGRTNWNYVKTVGCYIAGDIPQEDMQEIKNMFDNGITLWHNPTTFADYSQSNTIVS